MDKSIVKIRVDYPELKTERLSGSFLELLFMPSKAGCPLMPLVCHFNGGKNNGFKSSKRIYWIQKMQILILQKISWFGLLSTSLLPSAHNDERLKGKPAIEMAGS
jgi:hypothetical protein